MTIQHNFSLTTHTHPVIHTNTQDMFNLSINNSIIGVLDKFEKSMVQQNNVFNER